MRPIRKAVHINVCAVRSGLSRIQVTLMNRLLVPAAGMLAAALALTACEATKSSNPLSPAVAGPIPGVNISAPKILEPFAGQKIAVDRQPVTLLIENALTTGVRPLSYTFDIATDANFNNKVLAREGIAPGAGGRTSLRLEDSLATGRTYFWRARAVDGANEGPYTSTMSFDVFTPIVIEAPTPVTPGINATVDTLRPRFVFTNAARSGPVGAITYLVEVADSDSFANKIAAWTGSEQPNRTSLDIPTDLAYNKVYYWHVRAYDPTTLGPFSRTQAFATPPVPPPPPTPTPTPGPGPSPGTPVAADMIGLASVTILNSPSDLARWPVTTSITRIDLRSNGVHVDFSKRDGAGRWPDYTPPGWSGPLEYTLGMVLSIDGRYYASAPIEFWNGLDASGGPPSRYALNWFYDPRRWAPMTYHQPAVGEQIGFFVCAGDCRGRTDGGGSPVKERSNVVVVTMPSDAGASFTFR